MSRSWQNAALVLVALALALAHLAWSAGHLPERVASHFDAAGRPDGWTTRAGLLTTLGLLQVGLAGLFLGLVLGLRRLPTSLINLPHKDYWLAEARRAASLDWIERFLALHGAACLVFLGCVTALTVRANETPEGGLDERLFYLVLGVYSAFALGSVALCLWRFGRRPAA